ncbi:hypothetical protein NLG97_g681 [Lecanicillium saksenae]|uniref:Uncharacterized protein n=1 Tax=Lecanicillium saksenae TaxID=468837 RepID=A0ACC1R9C2_9HYPO|nr:hypothetical protein NLG97_g681 [Lecanicillium saksenae]
MVPLDPSKYAVAWIAPREIEARAALHMLDERHKGRFQVSRGDDYVYHAGAMGGHNIIIATLPAGQKYGVGSAAALAGQLKKFFPNLWFGLLVGVAAGLPDLSRDPMRDIRLGDVLVGLPEGESAGLLTYDLGKETEDGFQPLRRGHALATTEPIVRSAIGSIKIEAPYDTKKFLPYYEKIRDKEHATGTFSDPGQELHILFSLDDNGLEITTKRDRRLDSRRIRVWYGPIGSGDKLWKNLRKRNEIRDKYGLIGLEMEAAGTMDQIPVGVIRGVCDYGDGHENKVWQPYSAAMAAAYARALLEEIPARAQSEDFQAQLQINGTFHQSKRIEMPPTPSILIPFSRDSDFVERGDILQKIQYSCDRPGSRTALVGLGGVGKSQLAVEYAYRTQERFSNIWVFWIHASNSARFEQGFRDIATFIKLPGRHDPESNIFKLVHDWLLDKGKGPWVIILDNVDDARFLKLPDPDVRAAVASVKNPHPRQLRSYIPCCQHGSVLITSRSRSAALELVEDANIIAIKPMNEKDSLQLFQKKLGQADNKAYTIELAATLEYMPLAIVQAAAYVVQRRPRYSVRKYLDEFCKSDRKKTNLLSLHGGELRRDIEARNAIFLTWQISFDYIREARPSAADLLSFMSFCDRQGIPEMLLRGQIDSVRDEENQAGAASAIGVADVFNGPAHDFGSLRSGNNSNSDLMGQESNYSDNDYFENNIVTLRDFSFITANEDGVTFEMHRLVQLATLEWLRAQNTYDYWRDQFILKLRAEFPSGEYENWDRCQALYPHALSVSAQRPAINDIIKEWATILHRAAWFALGKGKGIEAEELSVKAMQARTRIFDKEHDDVIWSQSLVASTYSQRGRWSEAEKLGMQVMETRKAKLGLDHPHTLSSISILASIYRSQGRWEEAETLEVQALETRQG